MRKIRASGRKGIAPAIARKIPALAAPSGSRSPAIEKPEARSRTKRTRTTAARMHFCYSSFAIVSSQCWRSRSTGSMVTTGREPLRRQVDTVERGMAMCLGRHLVLDLATLSRRWRSYAHRVREVVVAVFGIPETSPAMAHQASRNINNIGGDEVAYTKVRNVCAHSTVLLKRKTGACIHGARSALSCETDVRSSCYLRIPRNRRLR